MIKDYQDLTPSEIAEVKQLILKMMKTRRFASKMIQEYELDMDSCFQSFLDCFKLNLFKADIENGDVVIKHPLKEEWRKVEWE